MRSTVPLLLLLLTGCGLEPALGPAVVVGGAPVALTGRTPIDYMAGWVTGGDCSVVRLERREPWCAPPAGPPPTVPYCTRSLGAVDCWTSPPLGSAPQHGVADPAR